MFVWSELPVGEKMSMGLFMSESRHPGSPIGSVLGSRDQVGIGPVKSRMASLDSVIVPGCTTVKTCYRFQMALLGHKRTF